MATVIKGLFGSKEPLRGYEILAPKSYSSGTPVTSKSGLSAARIAESELEQIYKSDGIAFSIINRYTNAIVGPGYVLKCEDPKQEEMWVEWARRSRFKRNIHRAIKNAWIYGNGYLELVRNVANDNIVKLNNVYPPTIDYQKTDAGRIIFNSETKEPKGYTQEVYTEKGLEKNKLDLEQIAHFRIMELGEANNGISPFEPLYKSILCKLNIDEAMAESAFRQAFPIYVAYVGLPDRDPTAEELDETHKEVMQVGQRSVFTFPHYTRLERLDSPNVDAVSKYANYFLDIITAGTGLPRALLLPTPGVTYAALERLGLEWEKEVKEYQGFLEEQIEDQIFARVMDINPDLTEVPQFQFKDSSPSMKLSQSRRISTLARSGLIVWDKKLEAFIRELEDLPPIDEETHLGRPMISMNLSEDEENPNVLQMILDKIEEGSINE
jgi:hypothetical protein